jgi:hypothetical protein
MSNKRKICWFACLFLVAVNIGMNFFTGAYNTSVGYRSIDPFLAAMLIIEAMEDK